VILDSSVILAVIYDESDRDAISEAIENTETVGIGAPTLVEVGIVLSADVDELAEGAVAEFVSSTDATVIAFGPHHWREALSAWTRFGRGRHPARLNFGDCLAYATARVAKEPLLAKGGEFPLTDIELA
jgi:ribonuclease VapC